MLKNERQVQSEYFKIIQYSLLVYVWSWLDASAWDVFEGDIKQGAEVTVDSELSFELPNPKSFWVTVVSDSYADSGLNTVEDNEGVLHQYCRKCKRLRVKFSISVVVVTNDKTNNCHYQQHLQKEKSDGWKIIL